MKKDYSSSVTLLCPTCANSDFESDESVEQVSRIYTCTDCGANSSYEDLRQANSEHLAAKFEEIKGEVVDDLKADLRKALKGFK